MITIHVYYANLLLFTETNLTYDQASKTSRKIMLEYGPEHYNGAYVHWKEPKNAWWFRPDMTPLQEKEVPAETRVAHFLIT